MGLRRWLSRLIKPDRPPRLTLRVDTPLIGSLGQLAERDGREPGALAAELLARKLAVRLSLAERKRLWETLTAREQQVAALICQGYTTPQIASQLKVKLATVKVHRRKILKKMGVHSQEALHTALAEWKFGEAGRE